MSRRRPIQRRSRERVELILQAAAELLAEGGVDALTMRSLAERVEIPAATIYRYFANREEIISAYLDLELGRIDEAVAVAVSELDRVTIRSLAHPEGVSVWFGGRLNPAVLDRVRELDARLADSLREATKANGMLPKLTPDFRAELVVRLFDRMFEFVFFIERTAEEQETIVLTFVDMVASYLEGFATPAGLEGIPADQFILALAEPDAETDGAPSGNGRRGLQVS